MIIILKNNFPDSRYSAAKIKAHASKENGIVLP